MIFIPVLHLATLAASCACAHGHCAGDSAACVCDAGFFGPSCADARCVKDCRGHGACEKGLCYCEEGWVGESCELRAVDAVLADVADREAREVAGDLRSAAAELAHANDTVPAVAPSA